MPDLPQPDPREIADRSSVGSPDPAASEPADAASAARPARRLPSPATLAMGAVMVGIALYGTAGFLRETGLYDVAGWW